MTEQMLLLPPGTFDGRSLGQKTLQSSLDRGLLYDYTVLMSLQLACVACRSIGGFMPSTDGLVAAPIDYDRCRARKSFCRLSSSPWRTAVCGVHLPPARASSQTATSLSA